MTVPDANFHKADGYLEREPDADFAATNPRCFSADGVHYCGASACYAMSANGMVIVAMDRGPNGLATHFTPAGIRQLCADLLPIADRIEAENAEKANAQLAATLARKGA